MTTNRPHCPVCSNTTSRPRTDAGKAIYRIALNLTKIKTPEQAATWVTHLHDFNTIYRSYMDEKTYIPKNQRSNGKEWFFTHVRVRKAYNQLEYAYKRGFLFTWLQPPQTASLNRRSSPRPPTC